ncbi:hypothetical protein Catovirus_1_196 [Catovirus CTV1]|uniref:Uncharacterized protein n=1 Tax=Catovirus CTV1 TaxID=1977631 RepID=A0A1V0S8W9_9VIRU|nr:hypothetical protein Catovirus_1_196 [Catovirus CTV1]
MKRESELFSHKSGKYVEEIKSPVKGRIVEILHIEGTEECCKE